MNGLLAVLKVILTLFVKDVKPSQVETPKNEEIPETMTSKIEFKNDSKRLQDEFKELETKNKELHDLLKDCANYCFKMFKKTIVITMIYRTQEEQDDIYKDDPKYVAKKFKSPHQLNHAADLRSSSFTSTEIKQIEDYLNLKYNVGNYYKWTARDHNVGLGNHFHIQRIKG